MSETTVVTAAETTVAAEKAPKAPRVVLPKQNGVSRPKDGTQTGRVWAISDELSAAIGKPAARKDVLAKGLGEGLNQATLATQYGRWRRFHGLAREVVVAKPAEAVAAPVADVTVVKS